MKIRSGFVSNSSSTCFILDLRNSEVAKLVKEITASKPRDLGRQTAKAIGKDAIAFANEYAEEMKDIYGPNYVKENKDYDIASAIFYWADRIGEENVVFLRESDEGDCAGMGGFLFNDDQYPYQNPKYEQLRKLALQEMDYH